MPRAIKLTEENIPRIVEDAKKIHFDLSYLKNQMEDNHYYGWETYLITDGDNGGGNKNITFTCFGDADFRRIWKFAHPENPHHFVKIVRV